MAAYASVQVETAGISGNGSGHGDAARAAVRGSTRSRDAQGPGDGADHYGYLLVFSDGSGQCLLWLAGGPPTAAETYAAQGAQHPPRGTPRPLIHDPDVLRRWRQVQTAGTWLGFLVLLGLVLASHA
jgi:hypothetical protein